MTQTATADVPHVDNQTAGRGLRQMMPTVIGATSRAALARLSDEDQHLFLRILVEQAEYLDHPVFRRRNCATLLYGFDVNLRPRDSGRRGQDDEVLEGGTLVLTAEEERWLFLQFNYARYRVYKLLDQHAQSRMPLACIRELLTWHRIAARLRAQITHANMPLVLAMARRVRMHQVDYNDLVSEGNLALLRSVDKFDASRGFKFSTYACRAILKAFSRVAVKASQYRSRFPTAFDPALERSDYAELQRDQLESDCVQELQSILRENLAGLSDTEQVVLNARFSLGNLEGQQSAGMTLEEVGQLIGVTKERVRQIQKKAMAKLRDLLEGSVLRV